MSNGGYTNVPAGLAERTDLSWTAKGIFLYYLSQPGGRVPSAEELLRMGGKKNHLDTAMGIVELQRKGLLPEEMP